MMRRFLSGVVAVGLVLILSGAARADHRSSSRSSGDRHSGNFHDYHYSLGYSFEHGYYYKGRDHSHWSHYYYSERYGTTIYFDPYHSVYYYWCQPDGCYYPVSYSPYGRYGW
jgi:hypothetical protein